MIRNLLDILELTDKSENRKITPLHKISSKSRVISKLKVYMSDFK